MTLTVENVDDTVTVSRSVSASVAATIDGGAGTTSSPAAPATTFSPAVTAATRSPAAAARDTASYAGAATGLTVNLDAGTATDGDTLTGIENATGGPQADTFMSGTGRERVRGGGGSRHGQLQRRELLRVTANLGAGTASDGDSSPGSRT